MKVKDKVCVVTGAAGGIGEAIARRYAREGAKVAIFDLHAEEAAALAKELGEERTHVEALDISDYAAVENAVDRTERKLGAIDGYKRPVLARTEGMHRTRDEFFSCPRLADDQNRIAVRAGALDSGIEPLHRNGNTDEATHGYPEGIVAGGPHSCIRSNVRDLRCAGTDRPSSIYHRFRRF